MNYLIKTIACTLFLNLGGSSFAVIDNDTLDSIPEGKTEISTETKLNSANYHINPTTVDPNTDKERRIIGIGETITISVEGMNCGNINLLEWVINPDHFDPVDPLLLKGQPTLVLTAKKSLKKSVTSTISVITTESDTVTKHKKQIDLKILVPNGIKATEEKNNFPGIDGNIINVEELLAIPNNMVGVRGFIKITLLPTTVNFSKINTIERDGGLKYDGSAKPSLASEHPAKDVNKKVTITNDNSFHDFVQDVYTQYTPRELYWILKNSPKQQQNWWWVCSNYIHIGSGGPNTTNQDTLLLKSTNQSFTVSMTETDTIVIFTCTITKFGIKFTRTIKFKKPEPPKEPNNK